MSIAASASFALTRAAWLADDTDVGDETHKAGPLAILVIAILCIACFFLFRSMSKHMRRVREEFPGDEPTGVVASPVSEPAASAGPAAASAVSPHAPGNRPAPKTRPRATDDSASR